MKGFMAFWGYFFVILVVSSLVFLAHEMQNAKKILDDFDDKIKTTEDSFKDGYADILDEIKDLNVPTFEAVIRIMENKKSFFKEDVLNTMKEIWEKFTLQGREQIYEQYRLESISQLEKNYVLLDLQKERKLYPFFGLGVWFDPAIKTVQGKNRMYMKIISLFAETKIEDVDILDSFLVSVAGVNLSVDLNGDESVEDIQLIVISLGQKIQKIIKEQKDEYEIVIMKDAEQNKTIKAKNTLIGEARAVLLDERISVYQELNKNIIPTWIQNLQSESMREASWDNLMAILQIKKDYYSHK